MFKLIFCIVPQDSGELITQAANSAGARGGTIVPGRGTASNSILQILGIGDTSKDLVYIIVHETVYSTVKNAILECTQHKKSHFGIMCTIDVDDFLRSGNNTNESVNENNIEGGKYNMSASYQMINVIVNKGFAEDAMAAARNAGAGGGTIINARGTAKEGDAKFFGMDIVPEKELLVILVPSEKKDAIISAIKNLDCLSTAGSGIIFCNNAQDFTLLGKK